MTEIEFRTNEFLQLLQCNGRSTFVVSQLRACASVASRVFGPRRCAPCCGLARPCASRCASNGSVRWRDDPPDSRPTLCRPRAEAPCTPAVVTHPFGTSRRSAEGRPQLARPHIAQDSYRAAARRAASRRRRAAAADSAAYSAAARPTSEDAVIQSRRAQRAPTSWAHLGGWRI